MSFDLFILFNSRAVKLRKVEIWSRFAYVQAKRNQISSFFLGIFTFNNRISLRPTSRGGGSGNTNQNGVQLQAGIADDQSKDFDFEKTEMKYDSTGMFHWSPAKNLEECILVGQVLRSSNAQRVIGWVFLRIVIKQP